jgi:hypothetical protein
MTKYYLRIDETGNFNILQPEGSFVCGVLTQISQTDLDALYIKTYNEIKIPKVTAINEVLPNVHWTKLKRNNDVYQQKSWANALSPKIYKLFRSEGKPTIAPNEQAYWVGAVAVVIVQVISMLSSSDELCIFIDGRARNCWDITTLVKWDTYHREIKKQLDDYVNKQTPSDKCKYSITFQNDDVNSFVNFADICCGILKSKEYRTKVADRVFSCSEKNQIAQLRQIISGLQGKRRKGKISIDARKAKSRTIGTKSPRRTETKGRDTKSERKNSGRKGWLKE